jgi:hypothetical protein
MLYLVTVLSSLDRSNPKLVGILTSSLRANSNNDNKTNT